MYGTRSTPGGFWKFVEFEGDPTMKVVGDETWGFGRIGTLGPKGCEDREAETVTGSDDGEVT